MEQGGPVLIGEVLNLEGVGLRLVNADDFDLETVVFEETDIVDSKSASMSCFIGTLSAIISDT